MPRPSKSALVIPRDMVGFSEHFSAQFWAWERRGRGWEIWPAPVVLEPPFRPFAGYQPGPLDRMDTGRKPTVLSTLVGDLQEWLAPAPRIEKPAKESEPVPLLAERSPLQELQIIPQADFNAAPGEHEHFFRQLGMYREPLAFEILGTATGIQVQLATAPKDATLIRSQIGAYFPGITVTPREAALASLWTGKEDMEYAVVEFGLAREFVYPLARIKGEPHLGIMGALAELQEDETGILQILFQPTLHPWAESIQRATQYPSGKPLFVNEPELAHAAEGKTAAPLFAVVIRIATRAKTFDRAWQIARDLAAALQVYAAMDGNELIPLSNDGYPFAEHLKDVLHRQCRRTGMLLNLGELVGLVHFPSAAVRTAKLHRDTAKTRKAPKQTALDMGLLLGENPHAGTVAKVCLTTEARLQHLHVIGASGTGKSTLLFNLIRQDIEHGHGLALLDPHGDLVEQVLGIIPRERRDDVVLVDPSDEEFPIGFNILSAHSGWEKNLLASDLVSVFERLSTSWGDQMGSVLQNAILAFLESTEGGTLADLRRFLIEPGFRERFLTTVQDPDLVYYWHKGFAHLTGNKSVGPVLTRLETFLAPKAIRYMVAQKTNRLDFSQILDAGKIFLAKLPQGLMGKENAFLLGSLLVSKFQQLAMARQMRAMESRRPFYLYIDEFHHFITPSMAEILTGARKYRLGLILAHQELRQLERDREVASAVLANSYTRIVFRVGDADARFLANGLTHFEAKDLQNLERGQAVCRIEKADDDFNLAIPYLNVPDPASAASNREAVITASRQQYATPRTEVEAWLRTQYATSDAEMKSGKGAKIKTVHPAKEVPAPVLPDAKPLSVSNVPETREPSHIPTPPKDLGRGGAQHQALQKRLKQEAEVLGYRCTIEKVILDGQGSVDLFLEREGEKLACEISVTTTIDHEVGNVAKCLKAGLNRVAVVCLEAGRLQKIRAAAVGSLGADATAQVGFYLPDDFVTHLKSPATHQPPGKAEPISKPVAVKRGYVVKKHAAKLDAQERQVKEEAAIRLIAEVMTAKPSPRKS